MVETELNLRSAHQVLGVLITLSELNETLAMLRLGALGVKLTPLTDRLARYIGVNVAGPYKVGHHRY